MSEFKKFAEVFRPIIDSKMDAYITFDANDNRSVLENAMMHSVAAGGKRLRPLLVLATHQLFSENLEPIYPLACAIELLHTYSLIHDDLPSMDNDNLRRGKPTCHVVYGEAIAILAGDTLNSYTYELIATHLSPHFPAHLVLNIIARFAYACGINGMSGGQVLDLASSNMEIDPEYLYKTHALKTGALIAASIILPAVLNSASPHLIDRLTEFGNQIGQLFQIADDILDVTGETEALGKTANKDADQNKLTYISAFGLDRSKEMLTELAAQSRYTLTSINLPNIDLLRSIVDYIETRSS